MAITTYLRHQFILTLVSITPDHESTTMNVNSKIKRLKTLIARLERADAVSTRSLSRVLTEAQLKVLDETWNEEKSCRKVEKPVAIKKYEGMVRTAILLYERVDKMYFTKSSTRKTKAMSEKAEYAFTNAFLFLEEAIEIDQNLQLWIDRDLEETSFDPIGIPRVIGSSTCPSNNALAHGIADVSQLGYSGKVYKAFIN